MSAPDSPSTADTAETAEAADAAERPGVAFWASVVIGWAVIAWGLVLVLDGIADTGDRFNAAVYLIGAAVVHDGLVAPAVCLVGFGLLWAARGRDRRFVQAGLIASGSVLLVAALPLLGTADKGGNPTIQPLQYGTATLTVLVVVWAVVGLWALADRSRRGRDRRG